MAIGGSTKLHGAGLNAPRAPTKTKINHVHFTKTSEGARTAPKQQPRKAQRKRETLLEEPGHPHHFLWKFPLSLVPPTLRPFVNSALTRFHHFTTILRTVVKALGILPSLLISLLVLLWTDPEYFAFLLENIMVSTCECCGMRRYAPGLDCPRRCTPYNASPPSHSEDPSIFGPKTSSPGLRPPNSPTHKSPGAPSWLQSYRNLWSSGPPAVSAFAHGENHDPANTSILGAQGLYGRPPAPGEAVPYSNHSTASMDQPPPHRQSRWPLALGENTLYPNHSSASVGYALPHDRDNLSVKAGSTRLEVYEAVCSPRDQPEVVGVAYDTTSSVWKYHPTCGQVTSEYMAQRSRLQKRDETVLLICPKNMVEALAGDSKIVVRGTEGQKKVHRPSINRLASRAFDLPSFQKGELRCMRLSSHDVYHIKNLGAFLAHASENHVAANTASGGEIMKKWAVSLADVSRVMNSTSVEKCQEGFRNVSMRGWAETIYLQIFDESPFDSCVDIVTFDDWYKDHDPMNHPFDPLALRVRDAMYFFTQYTRYPQFAPRIIVPRRFPAIPPKVAPLPAPTHAAPPVSAPIYATASPPMDNAYGFEAPSARMRPRPEGLGTGLDSPPESRDSIPCLYPGKPTPELNLSDEELAKLRTSVSLDVQQLRAEQLNKPFQVITGKEMSERAGFTVHDMGEHAGPAGNSALTKALSKFKDVPGYGEAIYAHGVPWQEQLGIRPPPALHPSVRTFSKQQIARGEDKAYKALEYERLVKSVGGDLQPTGPAFCHQEDSTRHATKTFRDAGLVYNGETGKWVQPPQNQAQQQQQFQARGSSAEKSSMEDDKTQARGKPSPAEEEGDGIFLGINPRDEVPMLWEYLSCQCPGVQWPCPTHDLFPGQSSIDDPLPEEVFLPLNPVSQSNNSLPSGAFNSDNPGPAAKGDGVDCINNTKSESVSCPNQVIGEDVPTWIYMYPSRRQNMRVGPGFGPRADIGTSSASEPAANSSSLQKSREDNSTAATEPEPYMHREQRGNRLDNVDGTPLHDALSTPDPRSPGRDDSYHDLDGEVDKTPRAPGRYSPSFQQQLRLAHGHQVRQAQMLSQQPQPQLRDPEESSTDEVEGDTTMTADTSNIKPTDA